MPSTTRYQTKVREMRNFLMRVGLTNEEIEMCLELPNWHTNQEPTKKQWDEYGEKILARAYAAAEELKKNGNVNMQRSTPHESPRNLNLFQPNSQHGQDSLNGFFNSMPDEYTYAYDTSNNMFDPRQQSRSTSMDWSSMDWSNSTSQQTPYDPWARK